MQANAPGILIVEDEPVALEIYRRYIKHMFARVAVYTATNVAEAIASFRKHSQDIIISDVRLPNKGDGLKIAKAICDEKPEAQIILVTADFSIIQETLGASIRHLCIEAVLGKPVDLSVLSAKIKEAIATIAMSHESQRPGERGRTTGPFS